MNTLDPDDKMLRATRETQGQPMDAVARAVCCSAVSPCSWQRHNGMDSVCPLCVAAAREARK
jgi:hypothetical protein